MVDDPLYVDSFERGYHALGVPFEGDFSRVGYNDGLNLFHALLNVEHFNAVAGNMLGVFSMQKEYQLSSPGDKPFLGHAKEEISRLILLMGAEEQKFAEFETAHPELGSSVLASHSNIHADIFQIQQRLDELVLDN